MDNYFNYDELDAILTKHDYNASNIIAILQDTQEVYRYLPKEVFSYLSENLGLPNLKYIVWQLFMKISL